MTALVNRRGHPRSLHDSPAAATTTPPPRQRVGAVDAARGLAIVVMLLAVHPGPRDGLVEQLRHPAWHGVHFADLFFPLFLFAVGASMPFSSTAARAPTVLRRAGVLFGLGLVLQLVRHGEFHLQGVLQHIAVAYVLAWLVLRLPRAAQAAVCAGLLVAAWAAYVAFADGDDPWSRAGGFAHTVNEWVFGGFRTEGVPQTVVSVVNVVTGAWVTQRLLAGERGRRLVARTGAWAVALVLAGLVASTLIPLNKHLWTPSFALLTVGTSYGFFALLHWAVDVRRQRWLATPLVELGSNAILIYALFVGVGGALSRHRAPLDETLAGLPEGVVSNGWGVVWLVLGLALAHVLYRKRLFFKV